jgi:thiamine pyrophosphate-dependent acetolactate synthase large subunit-like protein
LQALAELLGAPVFTSLAGKSAINETHPLALGAGGLTYSKQLHHFLGRADLIIGVGCSFSLTEFGITMPKGKRIIHATLDTGDLNKDIEPEFALIGDAALTLDALLAEMRDRLKSKPHGRAGIAADVKKVKDEWLAEWMPQLTSNAAPLTTA